jgi:hypothetical protein
MRCPCIVFPAKKRVKKFLIAHPLVTPAQAGAHRAAARTP